MLGVGGPLGELIYIFFSSLCIATCDFAGEVAIQMMFSLTQVTVRGHPKVPTTACSRSMLLVYLYRAEISNMFSSFCWPTSLLPLLAGQARTLAGNVLLAPDLVITQAFHLGIYSSAPRSWPV